MISQHSRSSHAPDRRTLMRHLTVILVVKVLMLTALWHYFVKPHRIHVNADSMAHRLAAPAGAMPEKQHD